MSKPDNNDDFEMGYELSRVASAGIAQAIEDGRGKYPAPVWKEKAQLDHLEHAINHLVDYRHGDRQEPHHLQHALFRIAAAYWQELEYN